MFAAKTIIHLLLVCCFPLLAPGCGKKTESPGGVTSSDSTAPAASGVESGEAALKVVLDELTQAVRKYNVEQKRVPKQFSEVVAAGYVKTMPAPPPGKKFEIDPKTKQVVLMKQ